MPGRIFYFISKNLSSVSRPVQVYFASRILSVDATAEIAGYLLIAPVLISSLQFHTYSLIYDPQTKNSQSAKSSYLVCLILELAILVLVFVSIGAASSMFSHISILSIGAVAIASDRVFDELQMILVYNKRPRSLLVSSIVVYLILPVFFLLLIAIHLLDWRFAILMYAISCVSFSSIQLVYNVSGKVLFSLLFDIKKLHPSKYLSPTSLSPFLNNWRYLLSLWLSSLGIVFLSSGERLLFLLIPNLELSHDRVTLYWITIAISAVNLIYISMILSPKKKLFSFGSILPFSRYVSIRRYKFIRSYLFRQVYYLGGSIFLATFLLYYLFSISSSNSNISAYSVGTLFLVCAYLFKTIFTLLSSSQFEVSMMSLKSFYLGRLSLFCAIFYVGSVYLINIVDPRLALASIFFVPCLISIYIIKYTHLHILSKYSLRVCGKAQREAAVFPPEL